jgi:hypothetical protein
LAEKANAMKYPKYEYVAEDSLCHFEFTSVGIKGRITKIDKKLEQFKTKVLFPKKLEMANRILSRAKLPL